jgi:hypothetical protein
MIIEFRKEEGWGERMKLYLLIDSVPYAECG